MTTADRLHAALAAFNTATALARAAYHADAHCPRCGSLADRHPNRTPPLCADCREEDR